MKKFILILIILSFINTFAFAQLGERTQRGRATQEMTAQGFYGAHFNFPLDSIIKVINTETQKEIEVTIIGRIPASSNRVIDLSREAYNALGLTSTTIVTISYSPPVVIRAYEPPATSGTMTDASTGSASEDLSPEQSLSQSKGAEGREIEVTVTADATPDASMLRQAIASERPRLNTSRPIFHLLVLDRGRSPANSDIKDTDSLTILYNFKHESDGYLVALYVSHSNGMVFPQFPDNSYIIVNMTTAHRDTIREYVNSAEFRRFVSDRTIINGLLRAINNY